MLKTRVITAVIAVIVLGVVLFVVPSRATEGFVGLVILGGAWEWSAFVGLTAVSARLFYTLLIALLCAVPYFLVPDSSLLVLQIACAWWLAAFIWTFFYPTAIPVFVRWVAGALVLVPAFTALILLFRSGAEYLLFALFIVWAADAGAYFAGKQFGRVKLAPGISPGKTWEGVIGGLLVVALLATVTAYYRVDVAIFVLLPFCLAVAAVSIVGDLTVSMFKRTAGIKDSGRLFPGHGGILDRIDSVSAAAPLFALGLGWLSLI